MALPNESKVVVVDENDSVLKTESKLAVHKSGELHRAFSVFIFNSSGQMLLQKRADDKYHSAGLWSNACCSHPKPQEKIQDAAHRRLQEEVGFDCKLERVFSFVYKSKVSNDLVEHEFDHVLVGKYDGDVEANPDEVSDHRWESVEKIAEELSNSSQKFTPWFQTIMNNHFDKIQKV